MRRFAIYRNLYGADFAEESVGSIYDHVDLVLVFLDHAPWGGVDTDEAEEFAFAYAQRRWNDIAKTRSKVVIMYDHRDTCVNQFTTLVNERVLPFFPKPDELLVVEADQVFAEGMLEKALHEFRWGFNVCATTRQHEIWRGFDLRVPERPQRTGVVLWNLRPFPQMPKTNRQAESPTMRRLDAHVHNLGFAASESTVAVKQSIAIKASKIWKDSVPDPNWYERWLSSGPESRNLEISLAYKHHIPHLEPYPKEALPGSIQKYYGVKL